MGCLRPHPGHTPSTNLCPQTEHMPWYISMYIWESDLGLVYMRANITRNTIIPVDSIPMPAIYAALSGSSM